MPQAADCIGEGRGRSWWDYGSEGSLRQTENGAPFGQQVGKLVGKDAQGDGVGGALVDRFNRCVAGAFAAAQARHSERLDHASANPRRV